MLFLLIFAILLIFANKSVSMKKILVFCVKMVASTIKNLVKILLKNTTYEKSYAQKTPCANTFDRYCIYI